MLVYQRVINGHATGTYLLQVPTIYKAYFSDLCKGISQQNMALYGTVPPFRSLKIPLI
jgi:hypothetical protein